MNLNKEVWSENDRIEFLSFLKAKERKEKVSWSQNILKTPSPVLALTTKDMIEIAGEIMKGNFKSFLDLGIFDYYEAIALYGMIISRMKSIDDFLYYLTIYLDKMDCWAHVDLLKMPLLDKHSELYLSLSKQYCFDHRIMVRRLSLFILFQYVKDKGFLPYILESLLDFHDEQEYYVVMMAGWLLSECIILHRDETLKFLENNKLNKKIQNKGIQKCRESKRLSTEEKDYLQKYKVK